MKINKEMLLITLLSGNINPYCNSDDITFDKDVNDCLIYMYFYMLLGETKEGIKMYRKFLEKYNKLSDEKKEFVKNDYINIINAQDENNKVKRKGEMSYE